MQSYTDIIADEAYNKGFKAGQKAAQKKYDKLFAAAWNWFCLYESSFGCPDEIGNEEFWQLRKLFETS